MLAVGERIPAAERDCETAASLALARYAQSYNLPNARGERRKAEETLLAVKAEGENNAYWQYAMGYVLFISNPAASAQHYSRALELGAAELGYDVNKYLIQSRLKQAERDARAAERRRVRTSRDPKAVPFTGFDFTNFWDDSEYAHETYVFPAPSDALIASVEKQLGYALPESYIRLMQDHNGGAPRNNAHETADETTYGFGVGITGLYALGETDQYTLCGSLGSRFMIEEWHYPDIGVYIGHTPSAGHDMIALDYRYCGPEGEPEVVHVDQEDHFLITFVADTFEDYIRGLTGAPDED